MFEDIAVGDDVKIEYTSDRSGNSVSRSGTVLQIPSDSVNVLFVQTGEDQLTGVNQTRVYSITIGRDDGGKRVTDRHMYLGEFEQLESQ